MTNCPEEVDDVRNHIGQVVEKCGGNYFTETLRKYKLVINICLKL